MKRCDAVIVDDSQRCAIVFEEMSGRDFWYFTGGLTKQDESTIVGLLSSTSRGATRFYGWLLQRNLGK